MSDKGASGLFGGGGNSLPSGDSQLSHIFGERDGHLPDTPRNRQLLVDVANNEDNYIGTDARGLDWYAKIESDGSQTWVSVYNGAIQDGGSNQTPRDWDPVTGLNRNPIKRRRNG